MKNYLKWLPAILMVVVTAVLLNKSATAAPPKAGEPTISPAGPATMQTKTIPVVGEASANPGVYWQQLDDGRFRATTSEGQKTIDKDPTSPPDYNYPVLHSDYYKFELDMSSYIPDAFFGTDPAKPYKPDIVSTKALVAGSAEYIPSETYKVEPGSAPTIVVGRNVVRVSIKTGGEDSSKNDKVTGTTNEGYRKRQVGYNIPMKLYWLGKVEQDKTLRVTPNANLQVG